LSTLFAVGGAAASSVAISSSSAAANTTTISAVAIPVVAAPLSIDDALASVWRYSEPNDLLLADKSTRVKCEEVSHGWGEPRLTALRKILALMQTGTPSGKFIDLGSGRGKV
jgi:hypothetical protein